MDTTTLSSMFDNMIAEEKEKELKAKEKEKRARTSTSNVIDEESKGFEINTESTWYFYNQSAVSQGISEFNKKWGRRPLEDNWRRSTKEAIITTAQTIDEQEIAESEDTNTEDTEDVAMSDDQKKQEWLAQIPFQPEEKEKAHQLIEEALYNLGNIYHFDLKEDPNAVKTFQRLMSQYPESEYLPEVLYLLYLIHGATDPALAENYKNLLIKDHPDSDLAKSLINPNYKLESRLANQKVKGAYDIAYDFFNQQNYDTAQYIIARTLNEYPDDPFKDHLELLAIMIKGKTEGIARYQYALDEFINTYSESELLGYAQNLRSTSDEIQKEIERRRGIVYNLNDQSAHSFILVYRNSNSSFNAEIIERFESFTDSTGYGEVVVTNLVYEEGKGLLLMKGFNNKNQALSFYSEYIKNDDAVGYSSEYRMSHFVISEPNFETFYKYKDLKGYEKFFSNHYYY
jgi:outer membrane protein assembly factor BamD (BamD/ComL family)